mmetsp:Transcript_45213/g.79599  ORF Transcript_45213/g.79599 Transcript_45213/m.79599 type:complete len:873 (+) Transcript_45213:140-2758(+)
MAEATKYLGPFSYNKGLYMFDIGMRWTRFTAGRGFAIKQMSQFREDVNDLLMIPAEKMRVYAPITTVCCGYYVTILIEGRSGLKFPAPPTFISGIYLQCLTIGFSFMCLGCWLVFHAGLRASVAAVQIRTRTMRLPVPTQRQLDYARKIGSSYEEQSIYDMFRFPFIMPNLAESPDEDDDEDYVVGKAKGSQSKESKGTKGKDKKPKEKRSSGAKAVRMPYRPGVPDWINQEFSHYDENPKMAPSTCGNEMLKEPYQHFEIIRNAQKDWWGAEVYGRICMLVGFINLCHGFGYWLVIHMIAELGMVWCAGIMASLFSASLWLIFHVDVMQEAGGCFPIEAGGPLVAAATLAFQYTGVPTPLIINISRAMAILCILMQITLVIRLYMVSCPANLLPSHAKEVEGGKNLSAPCEHPSWLPTAFQHVQYLVAPPRTMKATKKGVEAMEDDDPMKNVDMFPWYAVRTLYLVVLIGWCVLLTGRIVECATGERMLMTNPGQPPWTRIGMWDGWESGPITSKHYAHVTPMRGHWAWKYGQGPTGLQELWPSDLFGFAPEADMHWADEETKWPEVQAPPGAAVHDIPSHPLDIIPTKPEPPPGAHGHRRLRTPAQANSISRFLVPAAVQWPDLLEPELLACGPVTASGQVAALTPSGLGALVPAQAAVGKTIGAALNFTLQGLPSFGRAHGVSWSESGLSLVAGHGTRVKCAVKGHEFHCQGLAGPPLPIEAALEGAITPAVAIDGDADTPPRAAVVKGNGKVALLELGLEWEEIGEVDPEYDSFSSEPTSTVALSLTKDHLLVTASDGATFRWELEAGRAAAPHAPLREAPAPGTALVGSPRLWRSSCALPDGKLVRLASRWQRAFTGAEAWQPELLF